MRLIIMLFFLNIFTCFNVFSQNYSKIKCFELVKKYNTIEAVYKSYPFLVLDEETIVINKNEIVFYSIDKTILMKMNRQKDIILDTTIIFSGQGEVNKIHKKYFYEVIDSRYLVESVGLYGTENNPYQYIPLNKRVFDINGKYLTNIKPWHNIIVSGDGLFFASYFENDAGSDTLAIYNNNGDIIFKYYASAEAYVNFLSGSNILRIDDCYKKNSTLIDPVNKIISFNYMKELKGCGYMPEIFISNSYKKVLLSNYYNLVLFDIDKGIMWKTKENLVQNCLFRENKNELVICVWNNLSKNKNDRYIIKRVNLIDGNVINSIIADEVLFFNAQKFMIKKRGYYYEYSNN